MEIRRPPVLLMDRYLRAWREGSPFRLTNARSPHYRVGRGNRSHYEDRGEGEAPAEPLGSLRRGQVPGGPHSQRLGGSLALPSVPQDLKQYEVRERLPQMNPGLELQICVYRRLSADPIPR